MQSLHLLRSPRIHSARSAARAFALALGVLVASSAIPTFTHAAQVPLDPTTLPQFVEPLPFPGVLNGATTSRRSPLTITMSEFQQKVLPAGFYTALPSPYRNGTYVWGYNGSYPGPTIVAKRNTPTYVKYVNNLYNSSGAPLFLQGNLFVDRTVHWADPLNQGIGFTPYTGPVPAAVHLHGGEVPSAFDGGPNAWWTPKLAQKGSGFVSDRYTYPNGQEGTVMFYHDHALGMTRINVYSGLAGFYILTDPTLEPANLPGGTADRSADRYGHAYRIGIAIQDRMFDTNGQLFFPHDADNPTVHPFWLPEFFGNTIVVNGKTWPYLNVEPRRYRFTFLNGSNARFYQIRLVNTAKNSAGPIFWQIGGEQGLLDAPAKLNDPADGAMRNLLIAPAERPDVIIDFSKFAGQTLTLVNVANAPFPSGDPVDPLTTGRIMQFRVGTTVSGGADNSLNPQTDRAIRRSPIERPVAGAPRRELTLNEVEGANGPLQMFVNNTMWDMGTTETPRIGDTEVWEVVNLTVDAHPIHLHLFQFQILNRQAFDATAYATVYGDPAPGSGPPLPYTQVDAATGFKQGGNPDVTPYLIGKPRDPDDNEKGWKDTARMNPGEVTRIIVRVAPQDALAKAAARGVTLGPGVNLYAFEPWAGLGTTDAFGFPGGPGYVWHCHIIDHEDNEMMRPLAVLGPVRPVAASLQSQEEAIPLPATPELQAALPNPVQGNGLIRFALPQAGTVELRLFDVAGRQVRMLASGVYAAGTHDVRWAPREPGGDPVAPGVYFVNLRAGNVSRTQRVLVVP